MKLTSFLLDFSLARLEDIPLGKIINSSSLDENLIKPFKPGCNETFIKRNSALKKEHCYWPITPFQITFPLEV